MFQFYVNTVALKLQRRKPTTSNRVFHLFPEMPAEIRFLIWNQALLPRLILIEDLYSPCARHLKIPLLSVNQESRQITLEKYQPWGEFQAPSTHIFDKEDAALARYNNFNRPRYSWMFNFPIQQQIMTFFSWNYVDFENDLLLVNSWPWPNERIWGNITPTMESLFRRDRGSEGLKRVKHVAFDDTARMWLKEDIFTRCVVEDYIEGDFLPFKGLKSMIFLVGYEQRWSKCDMVLLCMDEWLRKKVGTKDTRKDIMRAYEKTWRRGELLAGDENWVCPHVVWTRIFEKYVEESTEDLSREFGNMRM